MFLRALGTVSLQKPRPASQSTVFRSPVRVKFVFLFLIFSAVACIASASEAEPVNSTQVTAWLVGGVSSSRLARLVKERGLATLPTRSELHAAASAGAEKDLMTVLSAGKVRSAAVGDPVPAALLKAAAEARQQHYHEAELQLREALGFDDKNSALHFALGIMLRQQEQFDDAF